jgi:hypothetical protein
MVGVSEGELKWHLFDNALECLPFSEHLVSHQIDRQIGPVEGWSPRVGTNCHFLCDPQGSWGYRRWTGGWFAVGQNYSKPAILSGR